MAFLKPMGSVCYDETGITFPEKIKMNFHILPFKTWWESFYDNTPKMLCFKDEDIEKVIAFLNLYYWAYVDMFIIMEGNPRD